MSKKSNFKFGLANLKFSFKEKRNIKEKNVVCLLKVSK